MSALKGTYNIFNLSIFLDLPEESRDKSWSNLDPIKFESGLDHRLDIKRFLLYYYEI